MSGYDKAQNLIGLGIPCSIVAAVLYRLAVPGDWDFQHGTIMGTVNAYIMLRLFRPSPLMAGRTKNETE